VSQAGYGPEFVALAVGTMNLVKWEFLLCEWSSFGLSAMLFGSANRGDSKTFDVSYSTFLISFENQTQIYKISIRL